MITELLKQMIKEEWRLHSELFSGKSFGLFPLTVLLLSSGFAYLLGFSQLKPDTLIQGLGFLGLFLGLSVGSIGFSSRDAIKNVLGTTSFLVYSSRTLPVSEKTLLTVFIVKDLLYYSFLFILPISLGFSLYSSTVMISGGLMIFAGFVSGILLALIATRLSLKLPGVNSNYRNMISPLADKTVLDIMRSSGGMLKIIFSLIVLTGFYWFAVLYFPITQVFLKNPVLSFSGLLGIVSLSVYNWINRFDSLEDYTYLPLDCEKLLKAKQKSFLTVSAPLITLFVLMPLAYYPTDLLTIGVALLTALVVQVYTLGLNSYLTGLSPNSRLFNGKVFIKYGFLTLAGILPLLGLTIIYTVGIIHYYLGYLTLLSLVGRYLMFKAQKDSRL